MPRRTRSAAIALNALRLIHMEMYALIARLDVPTDIRAELLNIIRIAEEVLAAEDML